MSFDPALIADPRHFEANRLPARSDHRFYRSAREAARRDSGFVYSLNGLWKFHYARNQAAAIPGFEAEAFNCRGWDNIRVPSHIQLEGWDRPQYVNVQNPWDGWEDIEPGQIPQGFNPVASYARHFTLPDDISQAGNLFVSFQGVESSFALWLNGKYVGYASDSMTPADFDLTPFYKPNGENKLAVQVYKWSAASWIQDQDFFRFSGIFRDVYLYVKPAVHVEDLRLSASLDDTFTKGLLRVALQTSAPGLAEMTLRRAGEAVITWSGSADQPWVAQIPNVAAWSAESPNLYELEIRVRGLTGEDQEYLLESVGFRRFEIKDSLMLLNGKRIVFHGVNRHEFGCLNGRAAMTPEDTELDLITMKRNNIDAIRTSHYPNNSFFYRLCDQYGLYVIDEANLEAHSAWDHAARSNGAVDFLPGDRPEWRDITLSRANNLYQRDKNHPCVLIWSCGNESAGGRNLYDMAELFRKLDPTRPVHYESVWNDPRYPATTDITSNMYTPASDVEAYLKTHRDKPMILCEYLHTMGNSGGTLYKYTRLTEREPLFQGAFIWDYIDQSLIWKDRYGQPYQAYGGDFGDRPADGNFCGNGIVYGDRSPSPKLQEIKYQYQGVAIEVGKGTARLRNLNLFTDVNAYECQAVLKREGRLLAQAPMDVQLPPLSEGIFTLPLSIPTEPGEYTLTVSLLLREDQPWASKGYEVAFGQAAERVEAPPVSIPMPALNFVEGWSNYGVHGENFSTLFSRLLAGPISYCWGGAEMLKAIPMPCFWRAPNDNDRANAMPARYGQWKLASQYAYPADPASFTAISAAREGGRVLIRCQYDLPTRPASQCRVCYAIAGDGAMEVTLTYNPVEGLADMPAFGMMFRLDADYDRLEWYGNGPEETYTDRMLGAKLDLYRGMVSEQMARYLKPQETGNKTGVRWARVTDARGRGLEFRAMEGSPMEFSALPYTPFELENAAHAHELPPVHSTIVRVNLAQMGVAGDNTWGALTHPEHLLPAGVPLSFTFSVKGV